MSDPSVAGRPNDLRLEAGPVMLRIALGSGGHAAGRWHLRCHPWYVDHTLDARDPDGAKLEAQALVGEKLRECLKRLEPEVARAS